MERGYIDTIKYIDIIKNKKYSSRSALKEDIAKCIEEISSRCFIGIFEKEDAKKFSEELSEAMIQDVEVMRYAHKIYERYKESDMDECGSMGKLDTKGILAEIVPEMLYEDRTYGEEYKGKEYNGLASYTFRYPVSKEYPVYEIMKENFQKMDMEIAPELYQWAYPVFWLEAINNPFSKRKWNQKKDIHFLSPIADYSEQEMYLFALILNDRASEDIRNSTIFAAVRRSLKHILEDETELNMDLYEDRRVFVKELREKIHKDGSPAVKRNRVFINNIITMRELIEIGERHGLEGINKPVLIIFLERLTGWIEFYNYVGMGEGKTGDYIEEWTEEERSMLLQVRNEEIQKITKEKERICRKIREQMKEYLPITDTERFLEAYGSVEGKLRELRQLEDMERNSCLTDETEDSGNAAFRVIGHGHIALLYCMGNWIKESPKLEKKNSKQKELGKSEKMPGFAEACQTIFGKIFWEHIAELDSVVKDAIGWEINVDVQPECRWYNLLYDELFVNDINNVREATRFEALNFYSVWRMTEG